MVLKEAVMEWLFKLFGIGRRDAVSYDGYRTIVYPLGGEPVIVNDTLCDFDVENMPASGRNGPDVLLPSFNEAFSGDSNFPFELDQTRINPATGLPMLFGELDVEGNPYGVGCFATSTSAGEEFSWD